MPQKHPTWLPSHRIQTYFGKWSNRAGSDWGIYLTCSLQLAQLRDYFRRELMVGFTAGWG